MTIGVHKKEDTAMFSVSDQGPGIDQESHAHLFEKFFQINKDQKVNGDHGYGLGLAICKLIVNKHGGTIGIDSEPGHGATFWFSLKLDEDEEE